MTSDPSKPSQRRPDRCVCPTPFAVLGHTFCMECLLTLREPFASMICEPVQPEAPPA